MEEVPFLKPLTLDLNPQKSPWVYFGLFCAALFILSYTALPFTAKSAVALFGGVLPLYLALRMSSKPKPREEPAYLMEFGLPLPLGLGIIGLFCALFLRFYRLEDLFCWPNLDEGWIGTIALELSRHWSWKFFYTFGEAPPLTIWSVALLLKLGLSPSLSLWLPPALVSILTLGVGYGAARLWFSKSFSLVGAGLLAFSYWPLLLGRLCHQGIWLPFWVCLCLGAWGLFNRAGGDAAKRNGALGMGIAMGLGSFMFTPWPVVTLVFMLSLFWVWVVRPGKNLSSFLIALGATAVTLLPFALAVLREGYGAHILSLSPWGGWYRFSRLLPNALDYLTMLFFGVGDPEPAYTAVVGGFLNPILGSFFFLGTVELFRLPKWLAAAFFLFLLPGALSLNVETFRVAQILPLVLFVCAIGIQSAWGTLPSQKQWTLLAILFLISGALDFHLLAAPYGDPDAHPENFGRPVKSLERYRAFQILDKIKKDRGPGLILADFDTDSFNDPTLSLMAYPFNAAQNASLLHVLLGEKQPPQWVAVFVNAHYEPFLKKRFPLGAWFPVSKGLSLPHGGELLGVIPVVPRDAPTLYAWCEAHEIFENADRQRFFQSRGNVQPSIQTLDSAKSLMKNDPFLESFYWDKRAAYEYVALDYGQQLYSYQMAVKEGYPTADLYYKWGELLRVKGDLAGAREAYVKATQAPLDLTPSAQILAGLKAQLPEK
jgi:4-amino-4-deoxy-L-arabinose transferase-like glycosyltransferase